MSLEPIDVDADPPEGIVEAIEHDIGQAPAEQAVRTALDPAAFAREHFAFDPYPYQRDVLDAVVLQGKQRLAWIAGRRVGKSEGIAQLVLQLAVRRPGLEVVVFAPSQSQATVVSRKVRYHLAGSKWEDKTPTDNVGELTIRHGTDADGKPVDSRILCMTLSGKVRGEGADVLVIDESAFCESEDYRNKALPFVVDRPDSVIVHISTVWAEDDHFMQAYRRYDELEHGATFHTPTTEKPGVTEAMLEEFRAEMLESEFRREYLGEIVAEGGVFSREDVHACLVDHDVHGVADVDQIELPDQGIALVGIDWGKQKDRSVIAAFSQPTDRDEPLARLELLEVYEPDPDDPVRYSAIVEDVKRVAHELGAHRIVADEGEGAHQAELLKQEFGSRFQGFRFTKTSKPALIENVLWLCEQHLLELPIDEEEPRNALLNVERRDDGYEHASSKLKDVFDAMGLALTEARKGPQRSTDVLSADREEQVDPSIPTPEGSGFAGTVGL